MRKIIHVDMDAFYASVEQRDSAELRGKPVIVAWSREARSVVVAASYEARVFGVRSAMPATKAFRLCPEGIYVKPNFEKYRLVSRQIREIFERHTPLVEPLSLDEAYLDVTHELTGIPTATETAEVIRREIRETTGLTASAGIAPNKFLAKVASDWNKPDGQFVIKPHQVLAFLEKLPVGRIPGVGRVTEAVLQQHGIREVGDVRRNFTPESLCAFLGKYGERLWELAHGIDESPVEPYRERKQISSETTFPADLTLEEVSDAIATNADDVWKTVAKKEVEPRTVVVKLRSGSFHTETRRRTLPDAITTVGDLVATARELLARFDFPPGTKYRLAGVGVANFATPLEEGAERPQDELFVE